MFSKVFIDRPIFASVLSIVITLAGAIALFNLPVTQYPEITPPTVEVSAVYPGANAHVVSDTVAAPIEQQVNGVEGMMYLASQCTNDGSYTLTVTFRPGTDLNLAQVLVQNRVNLAEPILPDLVKRRGVTVKKKSSQRADDCQSVLAEGSRDNLYLSNYATIQLRDELSRLAGVGDITVLGQRDYSMRVWLDPEKMADAEPISTRCAPRHRAAEHPGRRRANRPAARARRAGISVHDEHARPIDRRTTSSATWCCGPTTRAACPPGGCGARRAGSGGLRPGLHARHAALGRAVDLSVAGVQRARDGREVRRRWKT